MDEGAYFWELAGKHISAGEADEGTMMGNSCLRKKGEFVAMHWAKGGGMIVKLDAARVGAHLVAGRGTPFSPNGRVFKAWLAVPNTENWEAVLAEAVELG